MARRVLSLISSGREVMRKRGAEMVMASRSTNRRLFMSVMRRRVKFSWQRISNALATCASLPESTPETICCSRAVG